MNLASAERINLRVGTFETFRDVRSSVANRGKADVARTSHFGSDLPKCDISQPFMLSNEARFQPYQSARLRRMILPMSEGLTCVGGNFSECSEARQQRGRLRQGRNNRAGYDELAC